MNLNLIKFLIDIISKFYDTCHYVFNDKKSNLNFYDSSMRQQIP